MGQHIDVGVGIVMQGALADRRVVAEAFGDEVWIAEQHRQFFGDLRQRLVNGCPDVSSA